MARRSRRDPPARRGLRALPRSAPARGAGGADYAWLLEASRLKPLPLSLYVHAPFCETRCFFCGCNVVVSRSRERARSYLDAVEAEMALAAERLGVSRRRGIPSLNVDLIYGLPHQRPASFRATVAEVIEMAPDRIAVFNFAYLPALFCHQRAIDPAALPDGPTKLTLLEETIAALNEAGYLFLGMDHFARPGDGLAQVLLDGTLTRNFQGYSTGGETDLMAFGVSAISKVAGGSAQNGKALAAYAEATGAGRFATCRGLVLSGEDRLRREVIQQIMCRFRVEKAEVEEAFGIDFDRHFARELAELRPLADDGLVELSEGGFQVTPAGRLLVRNVAMVFDAYLPRATSLQHLVAAAGPAGGESVGLLTGGAAGPQPQFSRTV